MISKVIKTNLLNNLHLHLLCERVSLEKVQMLIIEKKPNPLTSCQIRAKRLKPVTYMASSHGNWRNLFSSVKYSSMSKVDNG